MRDCDYSISVVPAMQQYTSVPSCLRNGHYLIYDLKLKNSRELVEVVTSAIADDRSETSFNNSETEVILINDYLKDSFLDGESKRLDGQNKVENKDVSSITYSRSFSQEKSVNTLELNRLDT